jgi:hypothetical protein
MHIRVQRSVVAPVLLEEAYSVRCPLVHFELLVLRSEKLSMDTITSVVVQEITHDAFRSEDPIKTSR